MSLKIKKKKLEFNFLWQLLLIKNTKDKTIIEKQTSNIESMQNTLAFAQALDKNDPIRDYKSQFHIPTSPEGTQQIYFCGNSLGLQPKNTQKYITEALEKWQREGVQGWHDGDDWISYLKYLKEPLAKVVGAKSQEVTVMNNLTVNLHLMMVSFYQPSATKYKVLMEGGAFPSDQYALETHLKFRGIDPKEGLLEIFPRAGEHTLRTEDILALIEANKDSLAMVMLGGINYYTGQLFDMKTVTQFAQNLGITVGFDLAHAIGNVPLQLHDWGVDFAVWCTYKYLNAGMGGVSGVFVHEKHHHKNLQRLAGWWGYDEESRFEMKPGFKPMAGADGWQISTANILPMACLRASLEIFDEVGMEKIRQKSEQLTGFLMFVLEEFSRKNGDIINIITPKNSAERGSQVSMLVEKNGKELFQKLMQNGIIGDWREPNVIRLSPIPLYNSFEEVWRVGEVLASSR